MVSQLRKRFKEWLPKDRGQIRAAEVFGFFLTRQIRWWSRNLTLSASYRLVFQTELKKEETWWVDYGLCLLSRASAMYALHDLKCDQKVLQVYHWVISRGKYFNAAQKCNLHPLSKRLQAMDNLGKMQKSTGILLRYIRWITAALFPNASQKSRNKPHLC